MEALQGNPILAGLDLSWDGRNFGLRSLDETNGTRRLVLSTYEQTGAINYNELIRMISRNEDAKAAIAFQDMNEETQVWLQTHDYLHYYDTRTFTPSDVSTGADSVTIASTGYATGFAVTFTSTGTLPAGLSLVTTYYVRVSGSTLTFYDTSARAITGGATGLINITDTGTGVHSVVPTNTYNNNRHKHFSIEVSDSTGAKQSRFSVPYGYDTTEVGFFSSNVNVNDGKLRINSSAGLTAQFELGNVLSDNLAPDLANIRWAIKKDATAESGSNVGSDFAITRYNDSGVAQDSPFFIKRSNGFVSFGTSSNLNAQLNAATSIGVQRASTSAFASVLFDTNGTTQWTHGMRNDSTQDFHFRDSVNGRTHMKLVQSAGNTVHLRTIQRKMGTATAAANTLTLPQDGNIFSITGNTTINGIVTTNWQAGSEVTLIFTGTPTVTNASGAPGASAVALLLSGSSNLSAAANTVLQLVYDGTNWQETGRKVA